MDNYLKISILLMVCCFCSLCADKQNVKYEYYNNGRIRKKVVYNTATDSTNFTAFLYYRNGTLSHKTTFKNSKREGDYLSYYKNGIIKIDYYYKQGKKHGIQKKYSNQGELQMESFYLKGKHILLKEFDKSPDGRLYRAICYLVQDSTLKEIGTYIYDNKKERIKENASFFYKVYGKDTILANNTASYGIKFFNKKDNFMLKVKIGELNNNLSFMNSTEVRVIETYTDSVVYKFIPKVTGTQLLTGMLYIVKDTIRFEFPLYKEYFVKRSE